MAVLGKTGLNVKRIGFGGIPIQRIAQNEVEMLFEALREKGINFIDTARGYTISEDYIGKAIERDKNDWIIATKSMERTYEGMKEEVKTSLKNLKRDYIDIYQLHNVKVEEFEFIMSKDGAYRALLEAKEAGLIRHIGITSHSAETIAAAVETDYFETVQFPFNIVENQGEEVLKRAHEKNIGTIVMKPLAGGAIEDGRIALRYIMSKDFVDVAIPGMEDEDEVKENASIIEMDGHLDSQEIKLIQKIRKDLEGDFCRRCGYCMPCVKGINIPFQFILEGYYERYNLKDWAFERYQSQAKKASDCIGCRVCEAKCPYELKISEKMKLVDTTFMDHATI